MLIRVLVFIFSVKKKSLQFWHIFSAEENQSQYKVCFN